MPIEWILSIMLLMFGNLVPLIGHHFYTELPTWVIVVQLVMVFSAVALIIISIPKTRKMRKVAKENQQSTQP